MGKKYKNRTNLKMPKFITIGKGKNKRVIPISEPKFKSCISSVSSQPQIKSPYAICTAAMKKKALRKSKGEPEFQVFLGRNKIGWMRSDGYNRYKDIHPGAWIKSQRRVNK